MTNRTKYEIIALLIPFAIAVLSSCDNSKQGNDNKDTIGQYTNGADAAIKKGYVIQEFEDGSYNIVGYPSRETSTTPNKPIDPREYQIELNQDGSADIYDGSRHVGHLDYKQGEGLHELLTNDNQ